jgi:hypothetical protein
MMSLRWIAVSLKGEDRKEIYLQIKKLNMWKLSFLLPLIMLLSSHLNAQFLRYDTIRGHTLTINGITSYQREGQISLNGFDVSYLYEGFKQISINPGINLFRTVFSYEGEFGGFDEVQYGYEGRLNFKWQYEKRLSFSGNLTFGQYHAVSDGSYYDPDDYASERYTYHTSFWAYRSTLSADAVIHIYNFGLHMETGIFLYSSARESDIVNPFIKFGTSFTIYRRH